MRRSGFLALIAFLAVLPRPAAAQEDVARMVELMARVGSASSPQFSPDGKEIAFISSLSGLPQVWRMPVSGGFPVLVTPFDDPVSGFAWSPDGRWIAASVAPGGGLNSQVYLLRPDGTGLQRITDGGTVNNWLGDWMEDGSGVHVASNRRSSGAMDAWLFSSAGEPRLIAKNNGIGYVTDTSQDSKAVLLGRMVSRGSNDLYYVDLASGEEILLTPHEGPGEFSGEFAPDGRTIYLVSNLDRDRTAFARVRVGSDRKATPIEVLVGRDDAELDSVTINRQGTLAALLWNVAGRNELTLFDFVSNTPRPVPSLPNEIAGQLTFSRDGKLLAFTSSGAAAPSDIWLLDLGRREYRQLTRSPHAGVNLDEMVRPTVVTYRAHDGLPLSGWLYRAPGVTEAGPIVINFHGGPEGQERPFFNSTYQALLSRGISVFGTNVRGSSGFGKRFVNLDNGALRVDAVRDIKATVDHLIEAGIAEPGRIGIMGGSYGGYMVMAGLAEYPDIFAAGANLFGVVNFETFFKHTEPWMAAISTVEYGDPATEAEMLRRLSPIHKVSQVEAPTIVLHGANDTNVPVVEAEQVVESLRSRNVPVEYVLFPDEGHGWRKTTNRIRSTVEIVRWFETYLAK